MLLISFAASAQFTVSWHTRRVGTHDHPAVWTDMVAPVPLEQARHRAVGAHCAAILVPGARVPRSERVVRNVHLARGMLVAEQSRRKRRHCISLSARPGDEADDLPRSCWCVTRVRFTRVSGEST
jgi:hypothetical protein